MIRPRHVIERYADRIAVGNVIATRKGDARVISADKHQGMAIIEAVTLKGSQRLRIERRAINPVRLVIEQG